MFKKINKIVNFFKKQKDFYLLPDILTHNKKHANINKINQQIFNSIINVAVIETKK